MFKFEDQVEVHVPNTVMQRQHEGVKTLNSKLFELVADLERRYKDTDQNEVNSETIATKGGYQTPTKINFLEIDNIAIQELNSQIIQPSIKSYLEHHFKDAAKKVTPWANGWANILKSGNWQAPHAHPSSGTIASGVYYVKTLEDSDGMGGCIEFINPLLASWHHGFPYSRRIQPEEGLIVLFPPWYQHYVHPFSQNDKRCIVAFDVLSSKPGLDFVF